jgi:hypothetical protein
MAMLDFIPTIWEKIPQRIQQALAIAIGVGVVLCMLMALWLVWGSGYFQERLGIPLTKEDLKEQTETLQEDKTALIQTVVDASIADYNAEMQEFLRSKEEHARETILNPILSGMEALQRNQQQMMRSQNSTSQQVEQMPAVFDRKLDRLIQQTSEEEERKREKELLEKLLRRVEERENDDVEPEPEPLPKRNIRIKL